MGTTSELPQQLHVTGSDQDRQGILSRCPPSTKAAAGTHRDSRHLSEQKRDFFILLRPSKPLPHCFAILEPGIQWASSARGSKELKQSPSCSGASGCSEASGLQVCSSLPSLP